MHQSTYAGLNNDREALNKPDRLDEDTILLYSRIFDHWAFCDNRFLIFSSFFINLVNFVNFLFVNFLFWLRAIDKFVYPSVCCIIVLYRLIGQRVNVMSKLFCRRNKLKARMCDLA